MDLSGLTEHLSSIEDDAALQLPIGGRTYRVRPPSAAVGARCVALLTADQEKDDAKRAQVITDALGGLSVPQLSLGSDVVDQMADDGVPWVLVRECGNVALLAWAYGQAAAQRYLDRQAEKGDTASGEAKASRSPKKSGARSGTRSGSASKTR